MNELLVAAGALAFSLASVWLVHRLVMAHVEIGSSYSKTILSMEVVAVGILFAAFVLGEVAKVVKMMTDKSYASPRTSA